MTMQQVWRFRLWGAGRITTNQGKTIEVVEAGKLNTGPGPDFKDARIKIDDNLWIGNIEIHRHASDWYRHGHQNDSAYDNVVLHVVGVDDCRVQRADGSEVLQTTMQVDPEFNSMFNDFLHNPHLVLPMCGNSLPEIASIFKTDWITSLAFERLIRKADDILVRLKAEAGDWLQTVFISLARGLGFGTNADNMERLARSLPMKILLKHSDNIQTIEAMLFGQAGLLHLDSPADEYEARLAREYKFYAYKYGLTQPEPMHWQMSVRNIANTPYRRIALLARIIQLNGANLGASLSQSESLQTIRNLIDVRLSEYWIYSFSFGRTSATRMSTIGQQSHDLLAINVLVPLIYAKGIESGNYSLTDTAVRLWEKLDAERNSITRGFQEYGIEAQNAFTSQALIQLHREYCERRRCPECRLGHRLLSSRVTIGTETQ